MSSLIINPHKRIGSVIYVVEGEKTEPELIRHIYQNILGYNTLTVKDGEIMSLNKSDDKYSFVYVITAKHPQISLLEEKSSLEYMSYIYRLLTHNYNLDVENNALYFIFDRDRQSNSKKFIKDKILKYENSRDNDNNMNGLFLLSYPCIEAFYCNARSDETRLANGKEAKRYTKPFLLQDLNKDSLLKATKEFLNIYKRIDDKNFDVALLDKFGNTNNKILNMEENYYFNHETYITLSLLILSLLDLGIIEISEVNK